MCVCGREKEKEREREGGREFTGVDKNTESHKISLAEHEQTNECFVNTKHRAIKMVRAATPMPCCKTS